MSIEISAGLIPLILEACPKVVGRNLVNFSFASDERELISS
jgi:hypothetical protein